ncbi:MAG TPA: hypothetical protein VFW00_04720, partial [Rhodocyclaceae bacterium]|nr:hypothetical protein [Rhodocyclaceae bacterium]
KSVHSTEKYYGVLIGADVEEELLLLRLLLRRVERRVELRGVLCPLKLLSLSVEPDVLSLLFRLGLV